MKKGQTAILAIGLLLYLLMPAVAQMGMGTTLTAVEIYKPQESQLNAQQFLTHIFEHRHEGTLGGSLPLQISKEDLQTQFGLKDEELITASRNTSYFDRDGYRYFLMNKRNGEEHKEYLLVIEAKFEPVTKDLIAAIFGNTPDLDSEMYHTMIYKFGEYSVMFSNSDPKNRVLYDTIMISPLFPEAN